MKRMLSIAVTFCSLCLIVLFMKNTVNIYLYMVLLVAEYAFVLLLNSDFRKEAGYVLKRKRDFLSQTKHYDKIHLNSYKEDIEKMEPVAFEHFISDMLIELGYKTRILGEDKKYGGDIIARKKREITVVRVKHCNLANDSVSNETVQQIVSAMPVFKAKYSVVITNGKFTDEAYRQAKYCHTVMIDGRQLFNIVRQVKSTSYNNEKENHITETIEDSEKISKADCINEHLESVLSNTITEVTLESITGDENNNIKTNSPIK